MHVKPANEQHAVNRQVYLKFSEDSEIRELASEAGLSLSAYMRSIVVRELARARADSNV
jgi:hypothetical protein